MLKEFMLRSMLSRQLKHLPKEQQDMIIKTVMANPEVFQKVAESAQEKMKAGKSQQDAMMEAVRENEGELKKLFSGQ